MPDPTFASFMRDVDREITRISTLGVDDLGDFDYSSAFADECDPEEVAHDVLVENDFPF